MQIVSQFTAEFKIKFVVKAGCAVQDLLRLLAQIQIIVKADGFHVSSVRNLVVCRFSNRGYNILRLHEKSKSKSGKFPDFFHFMKDGRFSCGDFLFFRTSGAILTALYSDEINQK